ncbi:hypothetical protein M3J09_005089 [Ascochyta lentis]
MTLSNNVTASTGNEESDSASSPISTTPLAAQPACTEIEHAPRPPPSHAPRQPYNATTLQNLATSAGKGVIAFPDAGQGVGGRGA